MSPHHHAHHFESAEHEFESSKLGVWIFLCTEILMFGGLFVGYILYSGKYPEVFAAGSKFLDWKLGAINTAVLLLSSYTIAVSIRNIQTGETQKAIKNMAITLICGMAFMGIKAYEYNHKFHLGLYPGKYFNYSPDHVNQSSKEEAHGEVAHLDALPKNIPMYFSFYFVMTGIHGSHVIIGMALIFWCLIRAKRGDFSPEHYTILEGSALFWHLVDLVWIYLFPLLYLI